MRDAGLDTDYDFSAHRVVRPRGRRFELFITPRYEAHYVVSDYEGLTADLVANVLRGHSSFIDVGAHCGFFTLLAATLYPRLPVIALEPVPENRQLLAAGVARNGVEDHVSVVSAAASSVCGTGRLFIAEASDNCSFYPHPATATLREIEVETVTLNVLADRYSVGQAPLIKIDVDGHEMAVLDGAVGLAGLPRAALVIELNPKMQRLAGYSPEQLVARLHEARFDVFLIDDAARRFLRLRRPGDWRAGCSDAGYVNLYCVPRARALSVALFAHENCLSGAERTLLGNATALVQDHGAVITVVQPRAGELDARLRQLGVATIVAPLPWWCSLDGAGEEPDWAAAAAVFSDHVLPGLQGAGVDLVESMTMVSPWGALAAQRLECPHVWHVCEYGVADHGLSFEEPQPRILETIAASSDLILTPSETLRRALFPEMGDDRCLAIGRWFDPPADDRLQQRPERPFRIGAFAAVTPGKDPAVAIRATSVLRARGHDVELVLWGRQRAGYRDYLEGLIEETGVRGRVRFAGFADDPADAMRSCHAVVICAPLEAFGRTAFEALVAGVPPVITRSAAAAELLEHGVSGLAFQGGDAEDLARCIERLLLEPELAGRLVAGGREVVAARLDRTRISAIRFELFRRLATEGGIRQRLPRLHRLIEEVRSHRLQRQLAEAQEREHHFAEEVSVLRAAAADAERSRAERDAELQAALHAEIDGRRTEVEGMRRELDWVTSTNVWRLRRRLLRWPLVGSAYRMVARLQRPTRH